MIGYWTHSHLNCVLGNNFAASTFPSNELDKFSAFDDVGNLQDIPLNCFDATVLCYWMVPMYVVYNAEGNRRVLVNNWYTIALMMISRALLMSFFQQELFHSPRESDQCSIICCSSISIFVPTLLWVQIALLRQVCSNLCPGICNVL